MDYVNSVQSISLLLDFSEGSVTVKMAKQACGNIAYFVDLLQWKLTIISLFYY